MSAGGGGVVKAEGSDTIFHLLSLWERELGLPTNPQTLCSLAGGGGGSRRGGKRGRVRHQRKHCDFGFAVRGGCMSSTIT